MSWDKKKRKDEKRWKKMSKFGQVPGFRFLYDLQRPVRDFELPSGGGNLDDVSGICFDESTGYFLLIEDNTGLLTAWREVLF
jgi:hypothetical protein